jgi:outer membrane receptor for ferrienterochelin and colicins
VRPGTDLTELPIEQLMNVDVGKVYGASKIEQKTTEAPASITLVSSDEIKKYGYRTLGEILQSTPGFNVSYDRNYEFLGARGLSLGDFNDRMLILVNGHRINNNYNDGGAIGTDFILDVDLIERVEVIRGPGSVLYGNNAFFGIINVVTRQGQQLNGLETSGEYGSFDTYKARVSYGKLYTNGLQMLLSGTYYDSHGQDRLFYKEFNTPNQNNGIAQDMDADKFASGFGSLSYSDFTLEGAYVSREKVNPTAQFSTTFNDPDLRTTDDRGYANLNFAHSFPDVVDLNVRLYYDRFSHEINYPYSTVLFHEMDVGEWWGTEVQLTKRLWDRHVVTVGAEFRDDFRQDSHVADQTTTFTDLHTNRTAYGAYVQGDFTVLTNLHLIGGFRYDQYGDFDPSFNPRVALIYNPWQSSTFKAIYGTAFRAPSFYELSTAAEALSPEKITSYELVYEQEIAPHLRSSISGFYNQMDDLIVFNNGSFTNFNANTRGVEVSLEGFTTSGISGRASYSFQDTREDVLAWQVPDSPNHMVKFNLSVPIVREKLFAGLELQYVSNRRSLHNTTDAGGQPITVQGAEAGGYALVNLTLFSHNIVKNLEFSASVYNLLDRHYGDPASNFHTQDVIEQDGRTFRLKLTYRF